jgi:chemoreceptor zinc-binding protein
MKAEIQKAIGAHGMWKMRLRTAIESSKLDVPLSTVRADDQCDFGRWLAHAQIPPSGRERCRRVKALHADFHQVAARIVELALAGERTKAKQILDGDYTNASHKLTSEMMGWLKDG